MYRHKYFNNLPEFFNDYFTQNNEINHSTRDANKLLVDIGERTTQNILFQTRE